MGRIFPDIADILEQKREGREALAARSFVDKIKSMEALRERLAPFKAARNLRASDMETYNLTRTDKKLGS
jgi:hypothetical protein